MSSAALSNYIVLDTETTGFSSNDHIIQIAALRVLNHNIVATFSTYVNPGIPIPPQVTSLTGITDNDVQGAPCAANALPQLLEFMGGLPVVGHNIRFDQRMISYECDRLSIDTPVWEIEDTMLLSRELFRQYNRHRLSDLCERLHIINIQKHQALSDVIATQACYEKLCKSKSIFERNEKGIFSDECSTEDANFTHGWMQQDQPNLAGITFCITGELNHLSREQAETLIQQRNGTVKGSMSKKVNYLVRASLFDPNALNGVSTKTRRAMELIAEGKPVQIIDEDTFMNILGFERRNNYVV